MKRGILNKFIYAIVTLGILLSVGTTLALLLQERLGIVGIFAFLVHVSQASLPYIIYGVVGSRIKNPGAIIGAGLLVLIVDIIFQVHGPFFPGSSKASIVLFAIPPFLLSVLIIMPIGLAGGWLVGWLVGRLGRRNRRCDDEKSGSAV